MHESFNTTGTKLGTLAGTITILLANITSGDIIKTMILACFGTVVSFLISILLRKIVRLINCHS